MIKLLLSLLIATNALAASSTSVTADKIQNSAHTKVWTMPNATGTVSCIACTETLTNKTLDGGSNTFTNIPVTALNSGTSANSSTFWRGDGTWASPSGSGTVTSVAMTVPTFLSIAGSPVSSSGTLAVTLSGTALPVANGGTGVTAITSGTVMVGNGTSAPTLVAAGTSGNALVSNGSTWTSGAVTATATANVTTKTSAYNAVANDYILVSNASSSYAITLPTAVGASGQSIWIVRTDNAPGNLITVNTTSAQTMIGSGASYASGVPTLITLGEFYQFTADGANWKFIHNGNTRWSGTASINISATSAYVFSWTGSQNLVIGDTYSDGAGNVFTVSASSNTTTGTFSGTPGTPSTTGVLTRLTGTSASPITWTSRTITGQPAFGTTTLNSTIWQREGDHIHVKYMVTMTGAGTAGSGDYIVYFPSNLPADTTIKAAFNTSVGVALSSASAAQASNLQVSGYMCVGAGSYMVPLNAYLYSTTGFRIAGLVNVASNVTFSAVNQALSSATLGIGIDVLYPLASAIP